MLELHLSGHDETGGLVAHFVDHTSIPRSQFTDVLEIIMLQFTQISFLCEESLQTLLLLLIQIKLL